MSNSSSPVPDRNDGKPHARHSPGPGGDSSKLATAGAAFGAVAGSLPGVAKVGGSAIWAAGSYLSSYVGGGSDGRNGAPFGSQRLLLGGGSAPPAELDDGALRGLGSSEVRVAAQNGPSRRAGS